MMPRRKSSSNNAQSLKKKGFGQLNFLSTRQTRKNRGSNNNSATTRLGNLRRFSFRGNKTQPLLQSPVEEASAEFLKSGPLETPTGEFKGDAAAHDVPTRSTTSAKDLRLLSAIKEKYSDEDVEDTQEDTIVSKGQEVSTNPLMCGCFDSQF
jgi:hypothetical protein